MYDDLVYLCTALAVSLFAVALVRLLKPPPPRRQRLPPGPTNLPVVGSAHRLVKALPHRALRDLAGKHGPLMHLRVGQVPVVVVTSKELAREVLKTHDAVFTRPKLMAGDIVAYGSADLLFSPTGHYFRKLRKLCIQEILSNERVLSYQHIREDEVRSLVDEIRAAGSSAPVDLSIKLYRVANSIVSRAAFGMKSSKADDFLAAIKQSFVYCTGFQIPDLFPGLTGVLSLLTGMRRNLHAVHRAIDGILEEIIGEREQILKSGSGSSTAMEKNLVEVLLSLQGNQDFGFPITRTTVKAVILDMFAGGTETSGSTMDWAMSELMMNPKVMRKVQAELRAAFPGEQLISETDLRASGVKYLGLVIKETLRLHPPGPILVPRESTEACEIDGYTIPARTRVIINSWAIMRDPQYWEDAEEFRPERFDGASVDFHGGSFEYTPFGAGRRMCPGFNYGLASIELTLAQLLHSFDWSLPEGASEVDMTEVVSLSLSRKTRLMLRAVPHGAATAAHP